MQDIEKLLESGQTVSVKPQGYSMYPLFVPGRDEAVIEPLNGRRVKRGDVVLFRRHESILVLHRVLRRDENGFYFVGDNQTETEGPISEEQLRGILVIIKRNGKEISVSNPVYRFLESIWLCMRPVRPVFTRAASGIKKLFQ